MQTARDGVEDVRWFDLADVQARRASCQSPDSMAEVTQRRAEKNSKHGKTVENNFTPVLHHLPDSVKNNLI